MLILHRKGFIHVDKPVWLLHTGRGVEAAGSMGSRLKSVDHTSHHPHGSKRKV